MRLESVDLQLTTKKLLKYVIKVCDSGIESETASLVQTPNPYDDNKANLTW